MICTDHRFVLFGSWEDGIGGTLGMNVGEEKCMQNFDAEI
jgi:hypothetical protein